MARIKVGALLKSKDGGGVYFKVNNDFDAKKGDIFNVQTKKEQLASLEKAVAEGKLSGEIAETMKDKIEAIPDFVFADVFKTIKK